MKYRNASANANPFKNGREQFCFPKDDLVQDLKKNFDNYVEDVIGTRSGEAIGGKQMYFDGSGNYLDSGVKVQGGTPIHYKIDFFLETLPDYGNLLSCGGGFLPNKGIRTLIINTDYHILFSISDGSNSSQQSILITELLKVNDNNTIIFDWNGLIGGTVTFIVNGITETFIATHNWNGDSTNNMLCGLNISSVNRFLKGYVQSYYYTINNQPKASYTFENLDGITLLSDVSGATATINGTFVPGVTIQDCNCHSVSDTIGYSTCDSKPGVIIPLDRYTGEPVITCN